MTNSPASFVWYELMTTDTDGAERFYRSVIGWEPQPWADPSMSYTILMTGGAPVAGLMAIPEDARDAGLPPCWVGYIHAADVDAATSRVREAGGRVHREPSDIPGVGRFSVVADPGGAMFMLLNPFGGDQTPAPAMTPGHVGWHELHAPDGASAFEFYAGQFGWTKGEAMDMGPMGTYQLFAAGGEAIGGIMTKHPGMPSPAWLFYFTVSNIDEAGGRVREHGGQVLNGPHEVPGGAWILHCADPQGAMFALVGTRR
jgi:predicted enzyme related to lactoylglutathione lyase